MTNANRVQELMNIISDMSYEDQKKTIKALDYICNAVESFRKKQVYESLLKEAEAWVCPVEVKL